MSLKKREIGIKSQLVFSVEERETTTFDLSFHSFHLAPFLYKILNSVYLFYSTTNVPELTLLPPFYFY